MAAVEDGASFPTTAADAIRTMELIDAIYAAAGLPVRQPTPGRLMPLAADELAALADAALRRGRRLPGGRAPGRAHPQPDGPPARRPARDDGRRHRIRHGRARRGRRRGRVRRHGRRAAGGGGQPGAPGPGDGAGHGPGGRRARRAGARAARTATSRGRARSRSTRPTVPLADKVALLAEWSGRLGRARRRLAHVGRRCSPCRSRPTWPTSTGPGPPSTGSACRRSSRRWRCRTTASRPCARWRHRSAGAGST